MNLKVNNFKTYNPAFGGALDGVLTNALRVLDTNEMANAVVLDLGTMVGPRTYFDTKDRNKYAGTETFIREISGTGINCLSAGILAGMIAKVANKYVQTGTPINPKSWFSDDSINLLYDAWKNSENNVEKYLENVFDSMQGQDARRTNRFKDINWNGIEWFEENKWNNFKWDNPNYKNIETKFTNRKDFINTFAQIINDKNLTTHDKKQILEIMETRLTNALKANREVEVQFGTRKLSSTMANLLRDTFDMAKDVFTNDKVNTAQAIAKIKKVNNIKIFGALSIASAIGISMQKLNRKLTEKRTGRKGFVGEVDYVKDGKVNTDVQTANTKGLWLKKILASIGMIGMLLAVMKVKNPKDFVKKLQFTGPVSTGNAIKTVYGSVIVGRFLAADSNNELRESVVRDYFGFLNWLVLGGFASKGVANLLDIKQENLFNITKEGKGVKHWLNDVKLKTHAEIAAQGKNFAKKNLWKLNVAHIAGLAYSTIMLGILLPKINTMMTKKRAEK
ncbi:hypothetical protein IJ579_01890 [bacterium]|nr:hypothetical protein [bacterium]